MSFEKEFSLDVSHIENYQLLMYKMYLADKMAKDPSFAAEYTDRAVYLSYLFEVSEKTQDLIDLENDFNLFRKHMKKAFDEYKLMVEIKSKELITIKDEEEITQNHEEGLKELKNFILTNDSVVLVMDSIQSELEEKGITLSRTNYSWLVHDKNKPVDQCKIVGIGESIQEAIDSYENKLKEL